MGGNPPFKETPNMGDNTIHLYRDDDNQYGPTNAQILISFLGTPINFENCTK